jgi:putative spermidine/putrescine transport system permease protein
LLISTALPFVVLLLQSFSESWRWPEVWPSGFTGSAWRAVVTGSLGSAALTSTALGIATAVAAVIVALPIGRSLAQLCGTWRHVAAALVFLPVAAPPIALGAGLQIVTLWLGIAGTSVGVWFSHAVPAIGYVSLLFLGVFTTRGAEPEEAARTLGASRWKTWTMVLIPSLRAPITEALAIAFLISWTQVALTLVVGGGALRTLPLEVMTLVRAGQDRPAAVGALLLIVPAIAALAALRLGARRTDALPT